MILKAKNICKIYGGKRGVKSYEALSGINLSIDEGDFIAIMGPSGSGKTTLLNILSGIDKLTSGDVEINGLNISGLKKNEMASFRREKLGFVFQDFNLLDSLTLRENIMLPLVFENKEPEKMEKKAEELMILLDIHNIGDKYTYSVSGGEQQRASICRAIINSPTIVFADEPTGNLDSKASTIVMKHFQELNQKTNTTVLMVTHDAAAASFSNRVIFIKDGRINMEIVKKGDRKSFLEEIYNCLSILGGERVES